MMTLTSLLWSAGLELKLCHKDTSVSYYSASAAASCSQVLFMTELNSLQQSVLKKYVQNDLYQLSDLKDLHIERKKESESINVLESININV